MTQLKPEEVETPCLACCNDPLSVASAAGCKAYLTDTDLECDGYAKLKMGVNFTLNPFKGEPLRVAKLFRLVFNLNPLEENVLYTALRGGGLALEYVVSDAAAHGSATARLLTVASALQDEPYASCFSGDSLKLEGEALLVLDQRMEPEFKALAALCALERLKGLRVCVGCGYILEPLASTPEGRVELQSYLENAVLACGSTAPFRRMLHSFKSLIVNPHVDDEWIERLHKERGGRGLREGMVLLWRRGGFVERRINPVKVKRVEAKAEAPKPEGRGTLLERVLGRDAQVAHRLMGDMVTHAFTVETALGYLEPLVGGTVKAASFVAKLTALGLITREVGMDRMLYLKLTPRGLIAVKEYEEGVKP